jgi:hypothetical protein
MKIKVNVQKIPYKDATPGRIENHYAAFLTRSNDILLFGPFLTSNEGKRRANDVLKGKKESRSYFFLPLIILPVVYIERTTESYNKNLVDLVKENQISNCLIIENAPDSMDELMQFAKNTFKQISNF